MLNFFKQMDTNLPDKKLGREYYPFLDGFRAIAILWVILHHSSYFFQFSTLFGPVAKRFMSLGFLGVDVFFVTSGFLITGLLIGDLDDHVRLKRFYLRRFFKIFPQYFFVLSVTFLMMGMLSGQFHWKPALCYLFMVQNYTPHVTELWHLWSIAVEEHFYIVYPLILALACRLHPKEERRVFLIKVLIALIILGNFIRYYWFLGRPSSDLGNPEIWQVTHVRFDALMFGCLIKALEPYILKMKTRFLASMYFIGGFSLFYLLIIKFSALGWQYYTIAYVGTGLLFVSALNDFRPLKTIMEIPLLRTIGRSSYGIYLWHYPMIDVFLRIWTMNNRSPWVVIAYFICAIYFGHLTTKTIEKYFLDQRKKIAP